MLYDVRLEPCDGSTPMTEPTHPTQAPVTFEALLAERRSFWSSFTSAGTMAAGAIILLVLAMWVFLV